MHLLYRHLLYRLLTDSILTDTIELRRLVAVVAAVVDLIASEVVVDAEAVVAFVVRLTADPERLVGWEKRGRRRKRRRGVKRKNYSISNYGSNETMQNFLALICFFLNI